MYIYIYIYIYMLHDVELLRQRVEDDAVGEVQQGLDR